MPPPVRGRDPPPRRKIPPPKTNRNRFPLHGQVHPTARSEHPCRGILNTIRRLLAPRVTPQAILGNPAQLLYQAMPSVMPPPVSGHDTPPRRKSRPEKRTATHFRSAA